MTSIWKYAPVPLLLVAMGVGGCERGSAAAGRRTIVIGMDGLDPLLCERLMDEGRLPNLARLRDAGGYRRLATTMPPQSPVAWASFITGANPGVHGIFDFIHRDPQGAYDLYMGQARTTGGGEGWEVGDHRLPLTFWPFNHEPQRTELLRGGRPFWDHLDAAGIPVWLYDLPANYPPSPGGHGHVCCLAGMGVPDLLGSYGTYQYFSEDTWLPINEPGGRRSPLTFVADHAQVTLAGPQNTTLKRPVESTLTLDVYRHATEASARIDVQGRSILLREGEWSAWIPVDFTLAMPPFLPDQGLNGICRFFLLQAGTPPPGAAAVPAASGTTGIAASAGPGSAQRPAFRLYVSAVNIDPAEPGSQRISEPADFVEHLASQLGLFGTLGFQEDHKALSNGVFSDAQYQGQADFVLGERLELLEQALQSYDDGLLFFYISSTDLQAHMFWWEGGEPHPVRDAQAARRGHQIIEALYERMDQVMGRLLQRFGDQAVVMLMSDHGFANFKRQFHLNSWLRQEGYIQPRNCDSLGSGAVDWARTSAYGVGLNSLFLNLQGREAQGSVPSERRPAILAELSAKLLAVRDPDSGEPVVARVYRADEIYSGPHLQSAPDLLIGYQRGYRASWATTLGDMPDAIVTDNDSAWSADHCIAAEQVPGVIFSSRPIASSSPAIIDMAPTILQTLGLDPPADMEGRSIFGSNAGSERVSSRRTKESSDHGQNQGG